MHRAIANVLVVGDSMAHELLFKQVDLAITPQKRQDMLANSNGCSAVPQLHCNDKLVGDLDTVQDMEDFGELNAALQG